MLLLSLLFGLALGLNPKLHREMKDNGLFYEQHGTVAFSVEQCGHLFIDYNTLVKGSHFQAASIDTMAILLNTPSLHPRLMKEVLDREYELQMRKHLEEMAVILAKYLGAVPSIHINNDDRPSGSTEEKIAWIQLPRYTSVFQSTKSSLNDDSSLFDDYKKQEGYRIERIQNDWSLTKYSAFLMSIQETRKTEARELYATRFSIILSEIRRTLSASIEEAVKELFVNNRFNTFFMQEETLNILLDAIGKIMGVNDMRARTILGEARARGMSSIFAEVEEVNIKAKVIKVKTCFPKNLIEDKLPLLQIHPAGSIEEGQYIQYFVYPVFHSRYAVPPHCDSLRCLVPVTNCKTLGYSTLCSPAPEEPSCPLTFRLRKSCSFVRLPITENFLNERRMTSSTVIFSNAFAGQVMVANGSQIGAFYVPKGTFQLQLPADRHLVLQGRIISTRLATVGDIVMREDKKNLPLIYSFPFVPQSVTEYVKSPDFPVKAFITIISLIFTMIPFTLLCCNYCCNKKKNPRRP